MRRLQSGAANDRLMMTSQQSADSNPNGPIALAPLACCSCSLAFAPLKRGAPVALGGCAATTTAHSAPVCVRASPLRASSRAPTRTGCESGSKSDLWRSRGSPICLPSVRLSHAVRLARRIKRSLGKPASSCGGPARTTAKQLRRPSAGHWQQPEQEQK